MTENEARQWVWEQFGPSAFAKAELLVEAVQGESIRQNLIAPSTIPYIWSRHVVDSAQLVALGAHKPGDWMDIGTGAGFPGLVVALLSDRRIVLVEPRPRRAMFLRKLVEHLGLPRATVNTSRAENMPGNFSIVSARAVAAASTLFAAARHCTTPDTLWLLPKGRTALVDVAFAREAWHGTFHVEHSITEPNSMIICATGLTRK